MTLEIRPLTEDDVEAAVALRRESLADAPLAFAASLERDFGSDPGAVRARIAEAPESVVLGAFDADRLVGLLSVFREAHRKRAHRTSLFGMYVTPRHRRRGVARRLLDAAIDHAEATGAAWLQLSVSSAAPGAHRLYEAAGFEAWGHEPDALRHAGERASETHMALALPRR